MPIWAIIGKRQRLVNKQADARYKRLRVARCWKLAGIKCGRLMSLANLIQQKLATIRRCRLAIATKYPILLEIIINQDIQHIAYCYQTLK